MAASFLAEGLVDKLLVFVAPVLGGEGGGLVAPLRSATTLSHLTARPVGRFLRALTLQSCRMNCGFSLAKLTDNHPPPLACASFG